MTIQEVEARTGLPRATVRYYEREGLLSPQRLENGYRDYSEDNIATLFRIKLLRELGVALEDIRALQRGEAELPDTLHRRIQALSLEREAAASAMAACQAIREDGASYDTLDAAYYLHRLPTLSSLDLPEVTACPWRRYFARSTDVALYGLVFYLVLTMGFHLNLVKMGAWFQILLSYLELVMMYFLEPVLLHFFGTTPGKAIFGIRVEYADGGHLSYQDAKARTWQVIGSGMGYNIPIYHLVCLYRSWKHQREGRDMPWDVDGDLCFSIRENAWWRVAVCAAALLAISGVRTTANEAGGFPPNFHGLTPAEYAENYNFLCSYRADTSYRLTETGEWADAGGYSMLQNPTVTMETDDTGQVQTVTAVWSYRGDEDHIVVWPQDEIQSFSMALAAGEGGWLSYWGRLELSTALNKQWGSDGFTCQAGGVTVSAQVDQSGYFDANGEWYIFSGDADAQGAHCQITLTVSAT